MKETGGEVTLESEYRLKASDKDQSYLPDVETKMEFKLSFYRVVK